MYNCGIRNLNGASNELNLGRSTKELPTSLQCSSELAISFWGITTPSTNWWIAPITAIQATSADNVVNIMAKIDLFGVPHTQTVQHFQQLHHIDSCNQLLLIPFIMICSVTNIWEKLLKVCTYPPLLGLRTDKDGWWALSSSPLIPIPLCAILPALMNCVGECAESTRNSLSCLISRTWGSPSPQPFDNPTSTLITASLQMLFMPIGNWIVWPTTIRCTPGMEAMDWCRSSQSHWLSFTSEYLRSHTTASAPCRYEGALHPFPPNIQSLTWDWHRRIRGSVVHSSVALPPSNGIHLTMAHKASTILWLQCLCLYLSPWLWLNKRLQWSQIDHSGFVVPSKCLDL